MYLTRRLNLKSCDQIDQLALASGDLYSQTLVYFWRVVRKKGIWLSSVAMEKICNSKKMHAHSADAVVQAFFNALKSWRVRKGLIPNVKPPRRQRKHYKIQWKKSAMRYKNGELILSNGRGNEPLRLAWRWEMPVIVDIIYKGDKYVLIATYKVSSNIEPIGDKDASIDLGEVHPAAACDGENTYISNGRMIRSFKRLRNKTHGWFQKQLSTKKKGSRTWNKFRNAKRKQLSKIDNQLRDIHHKQSTALVSTLYKNGVHTIVIGDIRDIRLNGKNLGKKSNQKVHQMSHGIFRHHITYKAELLGMRVTLIDEAYTSQECPICEKRNKPKNRNYKCSCGFTGHRDGVGAWNILKKYRRESHVAGAMASPISIRYKPHMKCSL